MNDKTPGSLSALRRWLQARLLTLSSIEGVEKALCRFSDSREVFGAEKIAFYSTAIRILVTGKRAAFPEIIDSLEKLREELKELGYSCLDDPADPQTLLDNEGGERKGFYVSYLDATTGHIQINRESTPEEELIQAISEDIRNS